MTRAQLIAKGKLWQVYTHESIKPEKLFFEGSHAACIRWLRANGQHRNWRRGIGVRLGQIICED